MAQTSHPYTVKNFKKRLKEVGDAVKRARQSRGFTQNEMSDLIGISAKTISAIEVGRVEPSISQIQAIAAALQEPVGYFVGEATSSVEAKMDHVAQELKDIRALMLLIEAQKNVRGE